MKMHYSWSRTFSIGNHEYEFDVSVSGDLVQSLIAILGFTVAVFVILIISQV